MLEAPPPTRYKVIERDRRLIVIDTRTGIEAAKPSVPRELATGRSGLPKTSGLSAPPSPSTPSMPSRAAPGAGIVLKFAQVATGGRTDRAGRPILTTAKFYDPQGPREVALDPAGFRIVGWLGVCAAAGLMLAFLMFLLFDWVALIIVVFVVSQFLKPVTSGLMKSVLAAARPASY